MALEFADSWVRKGKSRAHRSALLMALSRQRTLERGTRAWRTRQERLTTRRASEPRKVELAQCEPAGERFQKRVEADPMGAGPTLAFEEWTALVNNCC
jgi:hypothetical protein